MRVRIEPAGTHDAPAVLALLENSGLPVDGVLEHLGTAIVARDGARVVGCAAVERYVDGALLRSVAVEAAARGSGVGQHLTREALELAGRLGAPAVYLLTTTAERFFPRFGFVPVARADVPPGVQQSVEFRSACPSTAIAMRLLLPAPGVPADER
jgi:amino-acid N-acetyltransferase